MMDNSEYIGMVARRYGELLLSCAVISALLKWVQKNEHLKNTVTVDIVVMGIGLLVFFALNVVLFRRCRFILGGRERQYYESNCIVAALFMLTNIVTLAICGSKGSVYQCVFQLALAGCVTGMRDVTSAVLFDLLIVAAVFASQIGMRPILLEAEREITARYE